MNHYHVGDVLLTHTDHFLAKVIRFGQGLRFRGDRKRFAKYNHAALVISEDGHIAEALAHGVVVNHISKYEVGDFALIHRVYSLRDRAQMGSFAASVIDARENGYGYLTILALFFTLAFGSKIVVGKIGTAICSGFVSEALTRGGEIFDRPPSYMMPADLAEHFDVPS